MNYALIALTLLNLTACAGKHLHRENECTRVEVHGVNLPEYWECED